MHKQIWCFCQNWEYKHAEKMWFYRLYIQRRLLVKQWMNSVNEWICAEPSISFTMSEICCKYEELKSGKLCWPLERLYSIRFTKRWWLCVPAWLSVLCVFFIAPGFVCWQGGVQSMQSLKHTYFILLLQRFNFKANQPFNLNFKIKCFSYRQENLQVNLYWALDSRKSKKYKRFIE